MSIVSISANTSTLADHATGMVPARAVRVPVQESADDGTANLPGITAAGIALPSTSINRVGVAAYLALMHPAPLSSMRAEA